MNQRTVRHRVDGEVRQDGGWDRNRRLPRQDAAPRVVVHDGRHLRDPLVLAQALVAAEEERLVLDDGSAERAAELVPAEIRLLVIEVVLPVEAVVPEELEHRAGEQVGARLGDDVEDAAAGAPVLRAHRVGDDAELLDGLDAGHDAVRARGRVVQCVVVRGAVEREEVLARSGAGHGNLGALADIGPLHARPAHDDARLQERELRHIAAVEWHRTELLLGDDV